MAPLAHGIGLLYAIVVTVYAIVTLLLVVISHLLSGEMGWVGLIQAYTELMLLPSLVFLPLSLLLRRWRLVLLLLPIAVVFVALFGVFFIPRSRDVQPFEATIEVLTFNLEAPNEGDVQSLIDIIRASEADIVAVQELTFAAAERFGTDLNDIYPHQALHPRQNSTEGQGVLSRHPITADALLEELPPLGHQRAELNVDGQTVVVYNTHPVPPFSSGGFNVMSHTDALEVLLSGALSETEPVLLVGDFNMTDQFDVYDEITRTYSDLYREVGEVGLGFTYPTDWGILVPVLRLDYVFAGPEFQGISARVWPAYGTSDHHPVFAQVALAVDHRVDETDDGN